MEQIVPAELAVILVNWRGSDDTIECLESLLRSPLPMRVIVCDNDSGDGSTDRIMDWAHGGTAATAKSEELAGLSSPPLVKPLDARLLSRKQVDDGAAPETRLTVIETGGNLGFAGGNNVGIRCALADPAVRYVWLLNNDTVVTPEAPEAILAAFKADTNIGMLGSTIRYYYAPDKIQVLNGARFNFWTGRGLSIANGRRFDAVADIADIPAQTDYVCGASLAVSRPFLEAVGLMEESYFLYFEEIDWACRNGGRFKVGFAPDAIVYHKEGGSIGSSNQSAQRSDMSEYYMARGKARFTLKHRPLMAPAVMLHDMLVAARRLVQGHPRKARAILRGMLGAFSATSRY